MFPSSFEIDFLSGTLHDSITFTRASSATYWNSSGVLTSAGNNVPRFNHNPSNSTMRGLLLEESRTNFIRNNMMAGAGVGTVTFSGNSSTGTGVLPTNWRVYNTAGLTVQVVATGVESGIEYVDIRASGTTASDALNIFFEGTNSITASGASAPQSWTISAFVKRIAGSFTNVSNVSLRYDENTSSSGYVNTKSGPNLVSTMQTTANLNVCRTQFTATTTGTTTGAISPDIAFTLPTGAAVDFTIRIGLPQAERGGFSTMPIKTSSGTATRAAERAEILGTKFSDWYNTNSGTFYVEAEGETSASPVYFQFDNGVTNTPALVVQKISNVARFFVNDGSTNVVDITAEAPPTGNVQSCVGTIAKYDYTFVVNTGSNVAGQTRIDTNDLIGAYTIMRFGNSLAGTSAECLNGHLKSFKYWPTRRTNTEMAQLVTNSGTIPTSPTPVPAPTPTPTPTPTPAPAPTSTRISRNIFQQPFHSTSIWNMPIGTSATYAPANLRGDYYDTSVWSSAWGNNATFAPMPHADEDVIIIEPAAPKVNIHYSSGAWGGNRCTYTSQVLVSNAPIPENYVVPSSNENNSTAIMMGDGRTIVQGQPFARCTAGGPATFLVTYPSVDLYGDGIRGAHGGSGLSSIGGTLRLGELRPTPSGQSVIGPRHALKLVVQGAVFLHNASTNSALYRWPANKADSGAATDGHNDGYGWINTAGVRTAAGASYSGSSPAPSSVPNNGNTYAGLNNPQMLMGALLAIPRSVNLATAGFESDPGKQIAWTLQNYGGYIMDNTPTPGFLIATEMGPDGNFKDQFRNDYGFNFEQRVNDRNNNTDGRGAWIRDILRLLPLLQVVSNNSSTAIGGGGTPLQPLVEDFTP